MDEAVTALIAEIAEEVGVIGVLCDTLCDRLESIYECLDDRSRDREPQRRASQARTKAGD